jgi:aminomethyltransferase
MTLAPGKPPSRAPVRAGAELFSDENSTAPVGKVTSGGFGPTVDWPVAMGYVTASFAEAGTRLFADVRGKRLPVSVSILPFITPRYKRS